MIVLMKLQNKFVERVARNSSYFPILLNKIYLVGEGCEVKQNQLKTIKPD